VLTAASGAAAQRTRKQMLAAAELKIKSSANYHHQMLSIISSSSFYFYHDLYDHHDHDAPARANAASQPLPCELTAAQCMIDRRCRNTGGSDIITLNASSLQPEWQWI
jgi:hypothetical protein